jgi:hypothetical protein
MQHDEDTVDVARLVNGPSFVASTSWNGWSSKQNNSNSATASRIIGEAVDAALIKPDDPDNRSRKHARYVPYWA